MTICDTVQRQLAEAGVEAADAEDIARHIEGCDDCSKFLADLQTIDADLIALTSHDAPDGLVADTLAAVRAAGLPEASPARPGHRQRWLAGGLAGGAVIAASLALTLNLINPALRDSALTAVETAEPTVGNAEPALSESESIAVRGPAAQRRSQKPAAVGDFRTQEVDPRINLGLRLPNELAQTKSPQSEGTGAAARRELDVIARVAPEDLADRRASSLERQAGAAGDRENFDHRSDSGVAELNAPAAATPAPVGGKAKLDDDARRRSSADFEQRQLNARPQSRTSSELSELNKEATADVSRSEEALKQERGFGSVLGNLSAGNETARGKPAEQSAAAAVPAGSLDDEKKSRSISDAEETGRDKDADQAIGGAYFDGRTGLSNAPASKTEIAIDQLTAADRFLMAQRSLDDLMFQEPTGYWANTYIPGDPEIRLLQARLAAWDRTALGQYSRLEQDVQPGLQPFDAPADAALAVTMASDATAIDGPTRLRVQVGLKGAERLGGRRPAMNIGLVVDLRSLADAERGSRIRALITALERARQPGDRFSLTVAGPAGGLLVAPAQFRHGPLQVALENMFEPSAASGGGVSLQDAMTLAADNVRAGDDPQAVLGSSLVMLVTGESLESDVNALERMAHDNAVSGVPLSVVSLAGRDNLAHIDRLVAAGQGNRRILGAAQEADGLVDRELHSASRAVARALRLRIRLAPGVKLVSVLDSRRLGEPQAAQVREAEVAIDQRLARNLGIEADRGDDEQGIQMVIPNFFAGDSHAVLLDVVAERPGPVADVTVRYKDVVNLKNGVVQASLALDDTPRAAGPLERSVLKNLIAIEFAKQTRLASRELTKDNGSPAWTRLNRLKTLIDGLRQVVPGWRDDPDLSADMRVLDAYLSAIKLQRASQPDERKLIADSLRVAAHRKLQPDVPR